MKKSIRELEKGYLHKMYVSKPSWHCFLWTLHTQTCTGGFPGNFLFLNDTEQIRVWPELLGNLLFSLITAVWNSNNPGIIEEWSLAMHFPPLHCSAPHCNLSYRVLVLQSFQLLRAIIKRWKNPKQIKNQNPSFLACIYSNHIMSVHSKMIWSPICEIPVRNLTIWSPDWR